MQGIFLSLQPFPARSQELHGRGDPVLCVQTDAIYFGADHLLSIHRTLKHAADSSTDRGGVLRIKLARLGSSIVTMMLMDEWAILEAAAEMDRYIKGGVKRSLAGTTYDLRPLKSACSCWHRLLLDYDRQSERKRGAFTRL
jgi:hypothetical protein